MLHLKSMHFVYSARTCVVLLGPVEFFFEESKRLYILFLGCFVRTKMVIGSPGIVADTSYDVINMAPVKSLIWGKFIIIVSIRRFRRRFYVSQKVDIA